MLTGDLFDSLPRTAPCVRSSLVDAIRSMDCVPSDPHESVAATLDDLFVAADHLFGYNQQGHSAICRSILRLIAMQREAAVEGE